MRVTFKDWVFLGSEKKSFLNKQGEKIEFEKASFIQSSDSKPFVVSVDSSISLVHEIQFHQMSCDVELYQDNQGYWKLKLLKFQDFNKTPEQIENTEAAKKAEARRAAADAAKAAK